MPGWSKSARLYGNGPPALHDRVAHGRGTRRLPRAQTTQLPKEEALLNGTRTSIPLYRSCSVNGVIAYACDDCFCTTTHWREQVFFPPPATHHVVVGVSRSLIEPYCLRSFPSLAFLNDDRRLNHVSWCLSRPDRSRQGSCCPYVLTCSPDWWTGAVGLVVGLISPRIGPAAIPISKDHAYYGR
jgi:hypothetical protein